MASFVRTADVPTAEFGDELAVMDLKSGAYITFNRTAADVWKLIETPLSLDAIADDLAGRYDVEPERCRAELETLLASLVEMGVVTRSES